MIGCSVAVATPTWLPAVRKRPWLYHSAGNGCRFWSRKTKIRAELSH